MRMKIALTLLLALVMVLSVGGYRQQASKITGLTPHRYWANKYFWNHELDIVLAGDSRAQKALSPQVMASVLGPVRIGNFGFSSAGYGERYLTRLESLLASDSKQKAIVLGVTPSSLTQSAAEGDNQFLNFVRQDQRDVWILKHFGDFLYFFEPIKSYEIGPLLKAGKGGYFQHYYADGWVAARKEPEDPSEAMGPYRAMWQRNKVSPKVVQGLLDKVKQWRRQGILVYAFFPPVSTEMAELEAKSSGFDQAGFYKAFQAAGGTWLELPPTEEYHAYDGSHLREDAARKLSKTLAREMRSNQGTLFAAN